ncbi:MAG TPA: PadR family transcriptional regulator [Gemmatimonadales bacterium]|jgi:transcriptional regulator
MAGSDLFTGSLDLLLLKAVTWGPRHGYAIARWLREQTGDTLPIHEGVLYPALHRLERKGYLDEEWGPTESNREAKFYRLTPGGRAALRAATARWRLYAGVMNAALEARRGP